MMNKKTPLAAGLAAFVTLVMAVGCAADGGQAAKSGKTDYAKMNGKELAEHLIFETNGLRLDVDVQEGGKATQRMIQDDTMKVCTETRNKPSQAQANKIIADARATIKYPEGGIKLGDWKKGRVLAWSGFGYRIGHNTDNHARRPEGPGGACYNCHTLATDRAGGTLGPSLTGYGKTRGNSEAVQKFVYDMVYNAHMYFPCTNMPRLGANGFLSQEQILDLMAYVLDPESPVNK